MEHTRSIGEENLKIFNILKLTSYGDSHTGTNF